MIISFEVCVSLHRSPYFRFVLGFIFHFLRCDIERGESRMRGKVVGEGAGEDRGGGGGGHFSLSP